MSPMIDAETPIGVSQIEKPQQAAFEFSAQELQSFKQDIVKTFDILNAKMNGLATNEAMACRKIHVLLATDQTTEQQATLQPMITEVLVITYAQFLIDTFPTGQMVVQFHQLNNEQQEKLVDVLTTTAVQITNTVQLDDPV